MTPLEALNWAELMSDSRQLAFIMCVYKGFDCYRISFYTETIKLKEAENMPAIVSPFATIDVKFHWKS